MQENTKRRIGLLFPLIGMIVGLTGPHSPWLESANETARQIYFVEKSRCSATLGMVVMFAWNQFNRWKRK